MRILHTSDWHVGRTLRGRSRLDEQRAVLAEIAGAAADHRVDLVLIAGDLFDQASPGPEAEELVYRVLLDLAAVAPVVIVAGNHDHPSRLRAVAPLLELGRVIVGSHLRRPEEGGVAEVRVASGTARIAMVPFLSKRFVVKAADLMELDADQHSGAYAGRVAAILGSLTQGLSGEQVNVVLAHLMVAGGLLGGGEREAHTVFDYVVPAQAFPGSLNYVALGHLHRQQRVPASAPVWYSGSPLQLDFGETGDQKGVLVVEAEPGLPARVERVRLEAGRSLKVIRGTLLDIESLAGSTGDAYVRIELQEPPRAGLAEEVREMFPNAVDVALAPPQTDMDPDLHPPRLGRPPHDLFREYLVERGIDDEHVLELFDRLMEEADAP
ncbi:MAG TPA: exonuclease subunit SbcD [Acidimicrobiia bacterium]